ncbi:hypothetical protein D3C71_1629200 [compost metagenome]
MLGALFVAPAQLRLHGVVLRGSVAPSPGAGDRPRADFVPMQLDQQLRRSAGEREAGRAQQPHVWGRVQAAQPFVDFLRRRGQRRFLPQGQVHLEDIALADIVLDGLNRLLKLLLRERRGRTRPLSGVATGQGRDIRECDVTGPIISGAQLPPQQEHLFGPGQGRLIEPFELS